ncbi:aldo/keto reductase [soil metagenome]
MKFSTRRLGRTSLEVTTLGLGGATLGGNVPGGVTDSAGRMIVLDGYDIGIRYFDTAPFYGYGRSEHVMGDELRGKADWVLSTKVGRVLKPRRKPQDPGDGWKNAHPFEPVFDYSYDGVMRSYEDSLQRLGLNRIDILYIHDVDVFTHGTAEEQARTFRTAMKDAYRALDELRRNGDVKAIGLGVNEEKPVADALEHGQWDVFLLAGRYTLLEQAPLARLFPALEKHGASIVIGGPFNSGILVGGSTWNYRQAPADVVKRVKGLAAVCEAHGVPLAAAARAFPLAHPVVASVIPGPRAAEELNQIVEWWQTRIPAGLWSDLKSEGLIDAAAPVPT